MKNITQASCCLLLSLLLWMGTGTAKPVDTLTAKTAATHFLMGRTGGNAKSARQVHIVYTGQALDESSQRTVPCYYIINMNQGFVIISADDRIEPILGYSTEGNFNAEDIPDNLRAFLDGYSTQIKEYLHDAPASPTEASAKWASLMRDDYTQNATKGAVIGPLLETTWDQNSPYNAMCPVDTGPGGHVYAGCVATAMAQVMRYWEYPSTGAGNKSYLCNFYSSSEGVYGDYGTLTAYFGYSTYNYANMPASISTSSPNSQISEIAKLIYHCGVSVEMMYGADGSGASVSDAPYALQHYFKYSSNYGTLNPQYKSKNSYTGNWISLLKSELDQWRPVIYRGQGTGGHAFVCDGYDDQNYFHFNWGWSGSYNGYYILTDLTPGPYTFNSSQGMVINIQGLTPLIKASSESLSFISAIHSVSEAQKISVRGIALSNNILVTAPNNFQISTDSITYSSSITLGSGSSYIYIRYTPTSTTLTTDNGSLTLTSGSTSKTITLTGRTFILECQAPQNLQAIQHNEMIDLSWSAPTQTLNTYRFSWDSVFRTAYGFGSSYTLTLIHRMTPSDLIPYHQKQLTGVSFFARNGGSNYKVVVYKGGSYNNGVFSEGTLITEQTVSSQSNDQWNMVTLSTPVDIDAQDELWYGVQYNSAANNYTIPVGNGSFVEDKGGLMKIASAGWYMTSDVGIPYNLILKAHIQDAPATIANYSVERDHVLVGTSTTCSYQDQPNASGTFTYDVIANWDNGCSATSEEITVNVTTSCEPTTGDTLAIACGSFIWYDSTYTVSTSTATHTFVNGNAHGCDSTVTLHLTVNPTYFFPENVTVNQGSLPFHWHGKTFNASTTAYDSLTTTAGCDSVYFLTLTVTAFNIIEDTPIALCQGETANWRGHLLSEQGTYRDTALAESTIHTVDVTVNPTYFFSENHTVNQGSLPFHWHGKTFNASATAYDSLTTVAGCDSVYFLNLTVTAFNIIEDNPIALCQGETANWRGHLLAEAGTYRDTVPAENTIHTVVVTVNPTYYFPENITVTQGSLPFNWHGKTFNASATAYDSLTTVAGCDSVYFLNLTVTAFNIIEDNPIALCQGETANWRGHLLAEAGTYRDTVPAENTIHTVVVTVNPTYYFPENITVTQGSLPFNWHGKTFNASATAYDSLTTVAGCDSVYFLNLTVTAFNIIEDNPIALCQGETANWRGHLLAEAGTYRDTVPAENTIHTVVVTVNPTYYFPENITVTQGSLPFNWHGKTFNASATAYDSLTTTAGCDSVYFLTLTVTAFNIVQDDPIALCQGETANWRGHLLAEQGTYRDTVLAENNIYTVDVTVNPTYYFPENHTVNQGSLPFHWHGKTFNANTTTYDSLTTTAGCDSVYFLTLTVTAFNIIEDDPIALCQGETANWRGHLLAEAGTYRDTVPAENTIHTVVVTVNPTYFFPENVTVNQGSLPFHWHGKTFNASATAYDSLTTTAGCDSVFFLTLTVTAFNIIEDTPIALCQGETANWRGHLLSEQGTYRDTVLAENNIYTVDVTVNPTYFFPENVTVTQGSLPFHWHGKTFNASATAYDSLTTTAGCDSVYFLTLTVTAFNIIEDTPIALCQGETANWRGKMLAEQGTYRDTVLAENNIYTVDVTVNPTYYFPENITVTQGSLPFHWHGKTFNANTTTYDSLTTTAGCDSVFFLTLTVTPFNIVQDGPIALCQGETANWRGHLLSEQGTYRDTVLAENTIYTVDVTVNPTYYFPENITVTQGSLPFNWHGKTFNASATAYDSLTTTAGCDSVYYLTITVTPFNIVHDDPIALCQGETANWRGHLLSEQGTYRDTVLAENTIYTVDVTVNPTYYFPENITVTQGSLPFNWHGKTFNASATAYDSLTTTAGCDSVFFLTLTVTAFNIIEDTPIALCQGETANWRGKVLAEQGTYRDTVLAENTIYTVDVTVNPTYYFPENITVTQGSLPFNWHGKTFNASATAYDSLTTTAGCDSVFFLTLTVTAFNIIEDTPIALCQGETANWRGKMLAEQGTYRDTVLAENNIYTVDVTVNPTYYFPENHTVNQGSLPFHWHGKTFNANTTTYDSLTTTAGCDSVYFLTLTVTAFNIIEDDPIALCQGETANWRGQLLSEAGTYRDTAFAENAIHTVVVTVNPTYFFPENVTVNQGSLPFHWHGKTFNASATAYDSLTTTAGCDSVFFLTLTVTPFNIVQDDTIALCQGETANWRGHLLTEQGTYRDTVLAENTIYTVVVTVNPTYAVDTAVTITSNDLPYHFVSGQIDTTFEIGTAQLSTFNFQLSTQYGCDSTVTLTLTINVGIEDYEKEGGLTVHPNPTTGVLNINGHDPFTQIQVLDAFGRIIRNYPAEGTQTIIDLNGLAPGVYIIRATNSNRVVGLKKIVKVNL